MRSIGLLVMLVYTLFPATAQVGWSTLNIPPSGRYDDVFFINDSVGWAAGGPAGTIRKTVNGGQTWTLQFTAPQYLRSIEFIDANTGFAGSLDNALYRTTNGGTAWTNISPGISPPPTGICGLSAPDASTIYGCGLWAGPAYIIKSTDGGDSWATIDMSAYASRLVEIDFITPDTGFVMGTANPSSSGGVILYTTDGGASWTPKFTTNMLSDIVWKIQRLDDVHFFASVYSEPVNNNTRMLRSTDGGMSWTMITVAPTYTYVEVVGFIDPLHGWTGGDNSLWETADGGDSWEQITLGSSYNRFFKVNDSTAYMSGQRIYKYRADLSTSLATSEPMIPAHSLEVRPTISNGRISIELRLDRPTIADLTIFGASGAIAETLLYDLHAAAGEHLFTTDLSTLSDHVFYVVLKTNEGMLYRKVVVTK